MSFKELGEQLHKEINSTPYSQDRVNALLEEIDPLNDRLTPQEDEFSFALGEGSRLFVMTVDKRNDSITFRVDVMARSVGDVIGALAGVLHRATIGRVRSIALPQHAAQLSQAVRTGLVAFQQPGGGPLPVGDRDRVQGQEAAGGAGARGVAGRIGQPR